MTNINAARPLPGSARTARPWAGRYPRRAAATKIKRTIRATTRPVGLSIIGAKWADAAVLQAGAAYKRARTAVLRQPSLRDWGE